MNRYKTEAFVIEYEETIQKLLSRSTMQTQTVQSYDFPPELTRDRYIKTLKTSFKIARSELYAEIKKHPERLSIAKIRELSQKVSADFKRHQAEAYAIEVTGDKSQKLEPHKVSEYMKKAKLTFVQQKDGSGTSLNQQVSQNLKEHLTCLQNIVLGNYDKVPGLDQDPRAQD